VRTYNIGQYVTVTFVVHLILLQQILQPFKLIEKFLDEGENAQSINPTDTSIISPPHPPPTNLTILMREAWPSEMKRANTSLGVTREQNFLGSGK